MAMPPMTSDSVVHMTPRDGCAVTARWPLVQGPCLGRWGAGCAPDLLFPLQ